MLHHPKKRTFTKGASISLPINTMPSVPTLTRRHFCFLSATLPSLARRSALSALSLLSAGSVSGLLSGCTTTSAFLTNSASTPVDDGGSTLIFLPALSAAPKRIFEARLRVRFLPKATDAGAPASPPALRAMIMTSPQGVDAAFTVLGLTIWTIAWRADGIHEKRHPKLNNEVLPDRMLRDLTLIHWPIAALQTALPADTVLTEDADGRSVLRNGVTILRITQEKTGQLRRTTLTNPIEGYVLTIEEAL